MIIRIVALLFALACCPAFALTDPTTACPAGQAKSFVTTGHDNSVGFNPDPGDPAGTTYSTFAAVSAAFSGHHTGGPCNGYTASTQPSAWNSIRVESSSPSAFTLGANCSAPGSTNASYGAAYAYFNKVCGACPAGQSVWNDQCVEPCPEDATRAEDGSCDCPGDKMIVGGVCACPAGADEVSGQCKDPCGDGQYRAANLECYCESTNEPAPESGTCPNCLHEAGDLTDLPDSTPAESQEECVDGCKVQPFAGLNITTKPGATGVVMWGIVKSPVQSCIATKSVPPTVNGFKCTTVDPVGETQSVTGCGSKTMLTPVADASRVINPDGQDLGASGAQAETIADHGCVTVASGAVFCIAGAVNVPDSGVKGQAATPDAVFAQTEPFGAPGAATTTYNYYQSSTVVKSTNYGSGTGNSGSGSGSSSGSGSGTGGGGTCVDDPSTQANECSSQTGIVGGDGFSAPSFSETLDAFRAQLEGSPIATSVANISAAVPDSGTCPTSTFAINYGGINRSFTIDAHCTLIEPHIGFIRALMTLMFAIAAAVVLLKA